jgi:hypothetical protein
MHMYGSIRWQEWHSKRDETSLVLHRLKSEET